MRAEVNQSRIVNSLFDTAFDGIGTMNGAALSEIPPVVGNRKRAEKIMKKAKMLKELKEDVVD